MPWNFKSPDSVRFDGTARPSDRSSESATQCRAFDRVEPIQPRQLPVHGRRNSCAAERFDC